MDHRVKSKSKLNHEDLQPIIDLLNKYYDGNKLLLTKLLDRSIYIFHFFSEDDSLTELQGQNWEYVQFQ